MRTKITYYLIYSWLYLHALLPFRALYILSDFLYIIVRFIVRYRIKVVRKNLRNSFPDKSQKELNKLEKEFYHHFCDYIVETIKILRLSNEDIKKRMIFKNIDLLKDLMKDGNSCIAYLGHYGNWEWIPSIALEFEDTPIKAGQIYKPLRNKAIDEIFLSLRSHFGSFGITKNDTFRKILTLKRDGVQTLIGFIADQTPTVRNIHYITTFLNQETAVFTGVERIAKQTGFVVAYLDITKIKRGKYICECKLISDQPKEEPEFAITERYIREFEKTILRNPAYWLWSHNRWKHKNISK